MLEYRIPTKRRAKRFNPASAPMTQQATAEEPIGLIEGKVPGSKEEWWIALALWKMGHDFSYQVPVFGGYWVRGGQIVDFIDHSTAPLDTIIQFNGDYWHGASSEERFSQIKLESEYLGRANVIVMWTDDASSKEAVFTYLRKRL